MSSSSLRNIILVRCGIALLFTLCGYLFLACVGVRAPEPQEVTGYAYSDMLSPEVFEDFEEQTGITVNLKYYEAVEELMTKLMFTQEEGIDVVAPSDSMVEILIKEGLLQKLQYKQIPCSDELDPSLCGQFYDPSDTFTVPFSWSPLGIAYDKRVIQRSPGDVDWDLVFGRVTDDGLISPTELYGKHMGRVCMGEDPWETVFLAAYHLFGSIDNLTPEKQSLLVTLLRRQKEWLECYTNNLRYFLISGISHAAVMPAAYVLEMQEEYDWVRFALPKAGSLNIIGCLGIPQCSKRVDLAHKVINYLVSKQGSTNCYNEHSFYPANRYAYDALPYEVQQHPYLFPRGNVFARLGVAHNQLPLTRVEQMWYDIKR